MGFFKDFKRDFAQAVNELMPESESGKKGKNKKAEQENVAAEGEAILEKTEDITAEESSIEDISASADAPKTVTESGADAISEAVLREEAERLRLQLGKSIDIEAQRASEEIDSEIDNLPDAPEGWSEEEALDESIEEVVDEVSVDDYEVTVETFAAESAEQFEETVEKTVEESFEEIPPSEESETQITEISSDADKLEAEKLASEVAKAEEERIIEEERLAAATRHAEEEAELKRIRDEEKKSKRKSKKDSGKAAKGKSAKAEEVIAREEERMPDLETEISKNDAYAGLSEDTTYITSKTAIIGNIETEDDIDIMGRVEGNITCSGKLIIGGRVTGNIKVTELYAHQAHIAGEIVAERSVKIGAGTISVGNISAESAVIAGAVKGDVDVKEQVIVDSSAVVVGNIRSKSIQVNSGAIVDGMCQQVYSEVNVEKLFDEEIENLDEESPGITEEVTDIRSDAEADEVLGEDGGGLLEIEGLEPLTADDADEANEDGKKKE